MAEPRADFRVLLRAGDTDIVSLTATHGDGGSAILLSEISAATFTLKDQESGGVINSRSAQNVLNTNNWTVHATSGLITWNIQPADTTLVDDALEQETHRGEFILTLTDGQVRSFVIDILCRARPYTV